MKKIFFFCTLLAGLILLIFLKPFSSHPKQERSVKVSTLSTRNQPVHQKKTLFVPYWTISNEPLDNTYDTYIYFGTEANADGTMTKDTAYKAIDRFLAVTNKKKQRLLGIRMINTDTNQIVLKDLSLQQKIISQSIQLAKEKGFNGIVLDFEISALGFGSVTKTITDFETSFANTAKKQQIMFYATMYGDTFFRFRPFDVKTIASRADGIMIMAYDFHKANGNPGPNFPLKDNQQEGYDFETMVADFLQQVSPDKITVIFGQYGYDWQVDDKGNSLSQAVALSDNQIKQKFLDACPFTGCNILNDAVSAETKITYVDSEKHMHIVWFENMQSTNKKIQFLTLKDINSVAYWAYSYF